MEDLIPHNSPREIASKDNILDASFEDPTKSQCQDESSQLHHKISPSISVQKYFREAMKQDNTVSESPTSQVASRISSSRKKYARIHQRLKKLQTQQLATHVVDNVRNQEPDTVIRKVSTVTTSWRKKSRALLSSLDPDLTDSSSGEDFGDEEFPAETSKPQIHSSKLSPEDKYTFDSARAAYKYEWLKFQISDLEYRICKNAKHISAFGDSKTVFEELHDPEGMSAARVCPMIRHSRKRLASTLGVVDQSHNRLPLSGTCCSCSRNLCCISCGGPGIQHLAQVDSSSTLSYTTRLSLLSPSYHRVLSSRPPIVPHYCRLIQLRKFVTRSKRPPNQHKSSRTSEKESRVSEKSSRVAQKESSLVPEKESRLSDRESREKEPSKRRSKEPPPPPPKQSPQREPNDAFDTEAYLSSLSRGSRGLLTGDVRAARHVRRTTQRRPLPSQSRVTSSAVTAAAEKTASPPRPPPPPPSYKPCLSESSEDEDEEDDEAKPTARVSPARSSSVSGLKEQKQPPPPAKRACSVLEELGGAASEDIVVPLSNVLPPNFSPPVYKSIETPAWRLLPATTDPPVIARRYCTDDMTEARFDRLHTYLETMERQKHSPHVPHSGHVSCPEADRPDHPLDVPSYQKRDFPISARDSTLRQT